MGIIASAAGRIEKAIQHFEESLAFCRKADYPPELAWTCCEYAGVLLEQGNRENQDKARTIAKEGLAIAEELGMVPLTKRLTDLIQHSEAQSYTKPTYPDGLTPREVEVLGLVVKGFTNQELGDLPHISNKTVATHIANIYEKSGSANRAEASAYAVRNGLAEQ